MGDIAAFGAGAPLRRRSGLIDSLRLAGAAIMLGAVFAAGCAPDYNWRETPASGGEYWVQLPAKPATLTRRIHLENVEVDMTMQGARVHDTAFTVGLVTLPAQSVQPVEGPHDRQGAQDRQGARVSGAPPERLVAAMREQMLRNIGAPVGLPPQAADAAVVDADGKRIGTVQLQAVSAKGSGRHAAMEMRGRFGLWQGHAFQIVAVGPDLDPEQAAHFLDSLRLVKR